MSARWSTGPVAGTHRAVLRDGRVVAIAESSEEAAVIVRTMNGAVTSYVPWQILTAGGDLVCWIDPDNQERWRHPAQVMPAGYRQLYVREEGQ